MKIKDYIAAKPADIWEGLKARLKGIWHFVRGHNLKWRQGFPEAIFIGCTGDIVCIDCPDTLNGDLFIWCRQGIVYNAIGGMVCGLLGHNAARLPALKYIDWDLEKDEPIYEFMKDDWYCYRCTGNVPTPDNAAEILARLSAEAAHSDTV